VTTRKESDYQKREGDVTTPQRPAARHTEGPAGTGELPPPPPPSLRERKRAATIHHVQATALALFTEHGFDDVTIEQVAEAADVSPSTVYRYFGTKEGLVIYDEYDDQVVVGIGHYLRQELSPWEATEAALDLVADEHFVVGEESSRTRIQLWFDIPSVQSAVYLVVDRIIDEIAREMASTGRWTFGQGRVVASAIIWPFVAALKNWHESQEGTWRDHLDEAVAALKASAPGAG
jgi:AcrR family transcriptional regulator